MSHTPDGLRGRLRHYVTLVVQIVPFLALAVNLSADNGLRLGLLMLPYLLASVGPILELSGRRVGRALTLSGLGLQVVAVLAFFVAVLLSGEGSLKLSGSDLSGVLLILGLMLVPAGLFAWNFFAGRGARPAAVEAA